MMKIHRFMLASSLLLASIIMSIYTTVGLAASRSTATIDAVELKNIMERKALSDMIKGEIAIRASEKNRLITMLKIEGYTVSQSQLSLKQLDDLESLAHLGTLPSFKEDIESRFTILTGGLGIIEHIAEITANENSTLPGVELETYVLGYIPNWATIVPNMSMKGNSTPSPKKEIEKYEFTNPATGLSVVTKVVSLTFEDGILKDKVQFLTLSEEEKMRASQPDPPTPAVIEAIEANDLSLLDSLISGGADLDERRYFDRKTALLVAAENGFSEGIERLITAGADPEIDDIEGNYPVIICAKNGFEDIAETLIKHGASTESRTFSGSTPLIISIDNNRNGVARLLIESGADIEAPDIDGNTPLYHAVSENNSTAMDLLLTKGADPNLKNKCGTIPLRMAAARDDLSVVKMLQAAGSKMNNNDCSGIPLRRTATGSARDYLLRRDRMHMSVMAGLYMNTFGASGYSSALGAGASANLAYRFSPRWTLNMRGSYSARVAGISESDPYYYGDTEDNSELEVHYLDISPSLVMAFSKNYDSHFYISAGVEFRSMMSATESSESGEPLDGSEDIEANVNDSDMAPFFGIGYQVQYDWGFLFIEMGLAPGTSDVLKDNSGAFGTYSLSVGIGK